MGEAQRLENNTQMRESMCQTSDQTRPWKKADTFLFFPL